MGNSDAEVLQIVRGINFDLNEILLKRFRPRPYTFDKELESVLEIQVLELVERNIVQEISSDQAKFISNVFLHLKPNCLYRMIIDLSKLNDSITKKHFKMEHLDVALQLISPGCKMASIDLKNNYYSVPFDT